jgi:hypothetical protein
MEDYWGWGSNLGNYYSSPQWPGDPYSGYSGEATAQAYSPSQVPGTYGAPNETPSPYGAQSGGGVSTGSPGSRTGMPNAYPWSPWGNLAGMFGLGGSAPGQPMTNKQRLAMGQLGYRMMQPPPNPAPYGMTPQQTSQPQFMRGLPYGDALRMMSLMQPGQKSPSYI